MTTKPKVVKKAAPAKKPVAAKKAAPADVPTGFVRTEKGVEMDAATKLHVEGVRAQKKAEKEKASAERKQRNADARAKVKADREAERLAKKIKTPEQIAKEKQAAENKASKSAKEAAKKEATKALVPIAKEINVRFEKADKMERDADDHRLAAALKLEEARKLCEKSGIQFKAWATDNVPQSFETVRKLVAIGGASNPKKALEDLRNKNKEANQTLRKKKKAKEAARDAEDAEEDSGTEPGTTQTKSRTVHVLEGSAAMKLAFAALSASDKMEFASWVAEEIGAKLDMAL